MLILFVKSTERSIENICHPNTQMFLHSTIPKVKLYEFIHRRCIVQTFLEKEAVDKATLPELERGYGGQVVPEFGQFFDGTIDLVVFIQTENEAVYGASSHPSYHIIVLVTLFGLLE